MRSSHPAGSTPPPAAGDSAGSFKPDTNKRRRGRHRGPDPTDQRIHTGSIERKLERLHQLGTGEVDDFGHCRVFADIDRNRNQVFKPHTSRGDDNCSTSASMTISRGAGRNRRCNAEPSTDKGSLLAPLVPKRNPSGTHISVSVRPSRAAERQRATELRCTAAPPDAAPRLDTKSSPTTSPNASDSAPTLSVIGPIGVFGRTTTT